MIYMKIEFLMGIIILGTLAMRGNAQWGGHGGTPFDD